jgi:HK97 family phage major capsid protein
MASVTLAESAKLSQDLLITGIIENIVTVNPIYELMPFMEIDGNALGYNRENALGDAQYLGVGGTITAKAAATFTAVTSSLTTLLGDAEINGLIEATRSDKQSQTGAQVASKAKSVARMYQDTMINGDGTSNTFTGLAALVPAGQKIGAAAAAGSNLSFDVLDQLIDTVKDKDGQVDYMLMPSRTRRSYFALLRALGGAGINDTMTLPSGRQVPMYRGVPIFVNDWMPVNQTQGSSTGVCSSIYAGTFDDGSGKHGISGLTARGNAGIRVENVGTKEAADEKIIRVKFYCGFANFSQLGVAAAVGILN